MDTTVDTAPAKRSRSKGFAKNLSPKQIAILVVVVALLAAIGVLYYQNRQAQLKISKLTNPQQASKTETDALVKRVTGIVALPNDETPTVATVVDASKLKSQAFFARSENGDKVLMYTKAKKAYLYRPNTNKLIEVASLDIKPKEQPQPAADTSTTKTNTSTKKQ